MKTIFGFWECEYCETRFVKEAAHDKHRCELMERAEFIDNTKRGRFAFMIYNEYMKSRGYIKQTKKVFRESKHYNSILKFASFYYEQCLPDMPDYVNFVVKTLDLMPQYWTRADVYEEYISDFETRVDPMQQAEWTLKHLKTMANALECEMSEVFEYIYVTELAKMVRSRRFSPWVLLSSKMYYDFLDRCDENERMVADALINLDVWLPRFRANPKARRSVVTLCKVHGI